MYYLPRSSVCEFLLPRANGLREGLECRLGVFPVDASIRDTDTVFEAGFALRWDLLGAYTVKLEMPQSNLV
jgi:hypothetical protein